MKDLNKKKNVSTEVEISKIIDKFWKPVVGLLTISIIGYVVFLGLNYYREKQETMAQDELFTIQKAVDKKSKELPKNSKKTPESLVKDFSVYLGQYDSFIKSHKGKKATFMAAVRKAGLAASFSDFDTAEKVLSDVVHETVDADLFYGLVRAQLATAYMNQKKFKEAIAQLEEVVSNKNQNYFHPHALIRLGTCYLETQDFDKAKALFGRVETDFPDTQAAQEAKNLQKLIAMKKGA